MQRPTRLKSVGLGDIRPLVVDPDAQGDDVEQTDEVSAHATAEVNDPPSPRDESPNSHFFGTKKIPDRLRLRRRIESLVQEASGIYLIVAHLSTGKAATAATEVRPDLTVVFPLSSNTRPCEQPSRLETRSDRTHGL